MNNMMRLGRVTADKDRAQINEVADRAIAFARKHETPLIPQIFHVWFAYCRREHEAINTALDTAMNIGDAMSEASLTALYEQHLSPRAMTDDLHEIGRTLHSALGEVSEAMQSNLKDNSSFSGTLRSVKQSLVSGTSKREVSEIITQLHKANQGHLASVQRMSMQMEKNRNKVSKLERELAEVKRSANTDYLTQLANRRRLDDLLDEALFVAREKGQPVSFAIGDIDGLEAINKKWGHSAGDNVMKIYARELEKCLQDTHIPARFSGAKFALLLPNTSGQEGISITEKVRASFKNINWVAEDSGDEIGKLTVSFGVTELRMDDTKEKLINRADKLLMDAKNGGRDRVVFA